MTCDKCHKEIQEGEERYTAMEPKAFRHAACHTPAPTWSVPPARESLQECARLGLLVVDETGQATGVSPKLKVAWGEYELVELIKALWPDIPPAGVPWSKVVERARQANEALNMQSSI